jgi:hypothetical protein
MIRQRAGVTSKPDSQGDALRGMLVAAVILPKMRMRYGCCLKPSEVVRTILAVQDAGPLILRSYASKRCPEPA